MAQRHLEGLKLVLTGDFEKYERDEAIAVLERLGADVTGSVSGKTKAVIVGKDPGNTKLAAAKKRDLPLLNEAQMLALIAGKTLEEVLAAPADEDAKSTTTAPRIATPFVDPPPRDGEWVERFPGTQQVKVSGERRNGLRHGSWKLFSESGQLLQDYQWERGSKHGHERDWAENGTKLCEGENRSHKRFGEWTWWHDNGARSYSYRYDDGGLRQGEFTWDLPDGSPRGRGQFLDDKYHGEWTWWQEPQFEKIQRAFHRGVQHGHDLAWFHGGQLAFKRNWRFGHKHGEEEVFDAEGRPTFKGDWLEGHPVGVHLTWDADGNETKTSFLDGIPESLANDEKTRAKVLKKLTKAKDGYAKQDAINDIVGYEYRNAYLLHLWKAGHVDVPADPELWEMIAATTALMSGADVVAFLGKAKTKGAHANLLPFWPSELDRIVMQVYARDPGPIDAAVDELPALMRKGVLFVRARFGHDIGDALRDELPALVKKHADDYGIGHEVLWPDENGRVVSQKLFADYLGTRTPLFDRLLALFGTFDEWVAALRERALKEAKETVARVSFSTFRDVVATMPADELPALIAGISLDNNTQDMIRRALTEWRSDDGETLARIALAIEDNGLRKWPAVCAAITKLRSEVKEPPAELLDALPVAVESPTYSSEWFTSPLNGLEDAQRHDPAYIADRVRIDVGSAVPRTRMIHEALRGLPEAALRALIERHLAGERPALAIGQFLYLVDDPALWRRYIELVEASSYGHGDANMYGLGDLGLRAIPLLEEAARRAKGNEQEAGWPRALLVALCRAIVDEGTFPAELDRHVRFDAIADDYAYRFYVPFLQRIIHLLPAERAAPILVDGLRSKHFSRAFRMIGSHPTREVLEVAFAELLEREATLKHEQQQDVEAGLASLPNPREWVKWILASGGGSGLGDAHKRAIGWTAFEELEKELASEGVEKAAPLDDVEKLRQRAEQAGGGSERIYLLRRIDEKPTGEDYNVIGGAAPGVDASRWPAYDDEPMAHLFTLDLETMPALRRVLGQDVRAVSVFCWRPSYNEAYEPGNAQTALLFTTEKELAAEHTPPDDVDTEAKARFEVVAIDVDPAVWSSDCELRGEIYRAHARVMGEPIWLQDEDHWGSFLMQFDEGFSSVNLGDSGVMYVFEDTAFWQCH